MKLNFKFGKTVRLAVMLGLTGGFFLAELIVGYMTNSMALVADSFHMLSDFVALIIGLFSVRVRGRVIFPKNKKVTRLLI